MEKVVHMNSNQGPSRSTRRVKRDFTVLNKILTYIFGTIGFVGFIFMSGINDEPVDFWKPLLICFSMFVFGIIGAWYFSNPRKARRTMGIKIYNGMCAIEEFIEDMKFSRRERMYHSRVNRKIRRARELGFTWEEIYKGIDIHL